MQVGHYSAHRGIGGQDIANKLSSYSDMFICAYSFRVHVLRDSNGASLVHLKCCFKPAVAEHQLPAMDTTRSRCSRHVLNFLFPLFSTRSEKTFEDPETGDPGDSAILKCLPAILLVAQRHQNSPRCLLFPWGISPQKVLVTRRLSHVHDWPWIYRWQNNYLISMDLM